MVYPFKIILWLMQTLTTSSKNFLQLQVLSSTELVEKLPLEQ